MTDHIFFLNCNIFGLASGGGLQMAKIWLKWCFFALMDNCANNCNNYGKKWSTKPLTCVINVFDQREHTKRAYFLLIHLSYTSNQQKNSLTGNNEIVFKRSRSKTDCD